MNTIGETLANLRRQRNMTQEALASAIGVSAQSISKWENDINMPDIMLLPIIANLFGVNIDTLFGRSVTTQRKNPDKAFENCMESVLREIALCCCPDESAESFDAFWKRYLDILRGNNDMKSAVIRKHGIVYFRDELGALLLKRPKDGWYRLFEDDNLVMILRLLSNDDFRKAMAGILKTNMTTFTLSSLCNACAIADPAALAKNLLESRLFTAKSIVVDETNVTIYELCQTPELLFFLAVLAYAREFEQYKSVYTCYHGETEFYTE